MDMQPVNDAPPPPPFPLHEDMYCTYLKFLSEGTVVLADPSERSDPIPTMCSYASFSWGAMIDSMAMKARKAAVRTD